MPKMDITKTELVWPGKYNEDGTRKVVWRRTYAHNDPARYGNNCDYIYFYSKGDDWIWNQPYVAFSEEYIKSHYTKMDEKGRKYQLVTLDAPAHGRPPNYQWKGKWPPFWSDVESF